MFGVVIGGKLNSSIDSDKHRLHLPKIAFLLDRKSMEGIKNVILYAASLIKMRIFLTSVMCLSLVAAIGQKPTLSEFVYLIKDGREVQAISFIKKCGYIIGQKEQRNGTGYDSIRTCYSNIETPEKTGFLVYSLKDSLTMLQYFTYDSTDVDQMLVEGLRLGFELKKEEKGIGYILMNGSNVVLIVSVDRGVMNNKKYRRDTIFISLIPH
jgi:hypothetical protein